MICSKHEIFPFKLWIIKITPIVIIFPVSMEGQKCHQLNGCKSRILSAKLLKHTADWLCWWRKEDESYMAFLTPSFPSVNWFKVYLILIIYVSWVLKIISFKPVVAVYDRVFWGTSLGLANCKKHLSKLPNSKSQMSSNTIWKENRFVFFFQLCHSLHILLSRSFFWDWDRSRWKSVANQLPLHTVCFQLELS